MIFGRNLRVIVPRWTNEFHQRGAASDLLTGGPSSHIRPAIGGTVRRCAKVRCADTSSLFLVVDGPLELLATLGDHAQPDFPQIEQPGQRILAPDRHAAVTQRAFTAQERQ